MGPGARCGSGHGAAPLRRQESSLAAPLLPCVNIQHHKTGIGMSETLGGNSKEQIKSIVERIENIETEIKERQSDRADIYSEAKGNGYDVKALRTIVRMRKQDPDALA